jgi:hypothetical protein
MSPDEAFVRGAFHEYSRMVQAAHVWVLLAVYVGIVWCLSLVWPPMAKYAGEELTSAVLGLASMLALWPTAIIGLRIRFRVLRRFCKRYPHVPPAPSATWCNGSAPCEHCGATVPTGPYTPEPRKIFSTLSRMGERGRFGNEPD